MKKLHEYTAFDCENCPLLDCYPNNPRCQVLLRDKNETTSTRDSVAVEEKPLTGCVDSRIMPNR